MKNEKKSVDASNFQKVFYLWVVFSGLSLVNLMFSAPIWPNWKYNQQLTGKCPYIGPTSPDILWSYDTGDTFTMTTVAPVIGEDGSIYFSHNRTYRLYALNNQGQLKWMYQLTNIPHYVALDQRGRIYVAVRNAGLLAIDDSVTYAKLIWTWGTVGTALPVIVGPGRTIYVSNGVDSLFAIDSAGVRKWATLRGGNANMPPAFSHDGQYLYFEFTYNMTIYIKKLTTAGSEVWMRAVGGAPTGLTNGSPTIGSDSTIYFAVANGDLFALLTSSSDKWGPLSGLGTVGIGLTATLGLNDTIMYMNHKWRPTYYKITPNNGTKALEDSVKELPSHDNLYNSFITDGLGQAYIMLRDTADQSHLSTLYAFNPNGSLKWIREFEGRSQRSTPAISPDGTMYIANGHYLYALKQNASDIKTGKSKENTGEDLNAEMVIMPSACRVPARISFRVRGNFAAKEIKIFDAAGYFIRALDMNGECTWDTRDQHGEYVCPGVYFCQVRGQRSTLAGKIIVLK